MTLKEIYFRQRLQNSMAISLFISCDDRRSPIICIWRAIMRFHRCASGNFVEKSSPVESRMKYEQYYISIEIPPHVIFVHLWTSFPYTFGRKYFLLGNKSYRSRLVLIYQLAHTRLYTIFDPSLFSFFSFCRFETKIE